MHSFIFHRFHRTKDKEWIWKEPDLLLLLLLLLLFFLLLLLLLLLGTYCILVWYHLYHMSCKVLSQLCLLLIDPFFLCFNLVWSPSNSINALLLQCTCLFRFLVFVVSVLLLICYLFCFMACFFVFLLCFCFFVFLSCSFRSFSKKSWRFESYRRHHNSHFDCFSK